MAGRFPPQAAEPSGTPLTGTPGSMVRLGSATDGGKPAPAVFGSVFVLGAGAFVEPGPHARVLAPVPEPPHQGA